MTTTAPPASRAQPALAGDRPTSGWLRLAARMVALICGAIGARALSMGNFRDGLILAGAGAVLLAVAEVPPKREDGPASGADPAPPTRWPILALGLVLGLIADYLVVVGVRGPVPALPWALGIGAVLLAFRDGAPYRWSRADAIAFVVLLVAGLATRMPFLEWSPWPLHGDEAIDGLMGVRIWSGEDQLFAASWLGHPGPSFFQFGITTALFGRDVVSLRSSSALLGALAIPALYLIGARAFNRVVGVLAALALLVNAANLHLSRMGFPNDQVVLLMIVGAGALLAVLDRPERRRHWCILGVTLGLSLHTYPGALVWPLIAAAAAAPFAIGLFRRERRALLIGLAIAFAGLLAAAGPMLTYFAREPAKLGVRGSGQSLLAPGPLAHALASNRLGPDDMLELWGIQIRHSIGAIHVRGDSSTQYGSPKPQLDPVAGVAFLFGIGALLRVWWRPVTLLLITWVTLKLFIGSAMLIDPPFVVRLVGLVPALALVAAYGLERLWHGLLEAIPRAAALRLVPAAACVAVGGWLALSYYFNDYSNSARGEGITSLTHYVVEVEHERTVLLVDLDVPPQYETFRYFAPDARIVQWRPGDALVPPSPYEKGAFVMPLIGPEAARSFERVRARFPNGQERLLTHPSGRPALRVWEVPAITGV